MKITGVFLRQILTFSPFLYESGKFPYFSKNPFIPPFALCSFGTKSDSNCNPREKMKLGLGNIKDLDGALRLYDNMSRMRPLPRVIEFTQLLSRLGLFRENKISEAQELFRKMLKEELCELSVVTYGTVINGLCKAGNTPMAIEVLRVMEKGRSSCKPNTQAYNMVIDSLCKDRMVDYALKLFNGMSEKGITPDIFTYNALVCGLCNLSRWEEAKMLVKKMIDYKIYPDVVTFSSLVDALCKEGLVDEAEDVIHIMKQRNVIPNVFTYCSLLDGYCLQGRLDEARTIFDSTMSAMNIAPHVRSYNILIHGYCKKKRINDAMRMFREMPRRGVKPNAATYTTILQGLFCCGKDSCALKLFDEMHEMQAVGIKPDFYTYCNILDGLCMNGQVERAVLFLDALEHKKGEIHLHISYYNIVMDGFCGAKKIDAARAIFRDLKSKGLEADVVTYNIMIKGCCQNGLLLDAQDFFQRMEEANLSPSEITYNVIVQGNIRNHKYEAASKFLEEMDTKGFSPGPLTLELLLGSLDIKEHNSTVFQIFQKWAPSILNKKQQATDLGV